MNDIDSPPETTQYWDMSEDGPALCIEVRYPLIQEPKNDVDRIAFASVSDAGDGAICHFDPNLFRWDYVFYTLGDSPTEVGSYSVSMDEAAAVSNVP